MKKYLKIVLLVVAIILIFIIFFSLIPNSSKENNNSSNNQTNEILTRESKIPTDAVKMTPETDENPVVSLSGEYENPVLLSSIINTAGAEDSPFIYGNDLYFFFTPDVRVPVEKQILDKVTGIYVSHISENEWSKPERIFLTENGKLALDGCEFVDGNKMFFCSAREGYTGVNWFSAEFENGKWISSGKKIDFPEDYQVGELHEYSNEIYFHSSRVGGKGGLDIWKMKRNSYGNAGGGAGVIEPAGGSIWDEPENVKEINTASDEGWPAISPDGNELWFSMDYSIWRSKKINNEWSNPEKIISPLAGEPSIDNAGNVYFVHHYYKNNKMIEADIYVAKRR